MIEQKNKKSIKVFKYLSVAMVFFVATSMYAQKEPQYTQYMYNIGSFNPAYVGSVEDTEIMSLYRAQWLDVPGAPTTIRIGANIPFSNEKTGLGFNAYSDKLGPMSQTLINISYSYQVKLSDNANWSFGINAGGSSLDIDFTKGDFEFENEPAIKGNQFNTFYPIIGAGTFVYAEDWYFGLSVPNLLTSTLYDDEVAVIEEDKTQVNFIGGLVFDLSDELKFKPAFLVNYITDSPVNVNLSTNFLINEKFTLGASYRFDNAMSGLAGFQVSNSMFIGYSYDYSTNAFKNYNDGSHEVVLKFYLGRSGGSSSKNRKKDSKKPKQIDTPRFF
ncbi:type IX secretion system membrane protein PorP/SprF [Cellulophaga sp. 20_2_10]|uniref:PorP/SprF family type IX secretion system membrane protein n=1 Tax=Cellulophaga sp. 20_2_10 TaxID=2942476 RepID=UPI00201A57F3|nr:type IX secretion system membrane protein PorP/SprF [Cellulophaga sp. 20_2_10]